MHSANTFMDFSIHQTLEEKSRRRLSLCSKNWVSNFDKIQFCLEIKMQGLGTNSGGQLGGGENCALYKELYSVF